MKGTYSLLCYTREATGREEANNEDIAYSMHLALRAGETAEWEPLNENYGIFFAAGVPIQAATAESRRACVAAAHFVADPFDEASSKEAIPVSTFPPKALVMMSFPHFFSTLPISLA